MTISPAEYMLDKSPEPPRTVVGFKHVLIIQRKCKITRKMFRVAVNIEDFNSWMNGKLAQYAFSYLTRDEREFLISNYTPAEWAATFGEED